VEKDLFVRPFMEDARHTQPRRANIATASSISGSNLVMGGSKGLVWPNINPTIYSKEIHTIFSAFVAQVLDIRILTPGEDKTGPADLGHLSIRGVILDVIWNKRQNDSGEENHKIEIGEDKFSGYAVMDCRKIQSNCEDGQDAHILCIPTLMEGNMSFEGRVPGPVEDTGGHFVRIGMFRISMLLDPQRYKLEFEKRDKSTIVIVRASLDHVEQSLG